MNLLNYTLKVAVVSMSLIGSNLAAQTVEFDIFDIKIGSHPDKVGEALLSHGFTPSTRSIISGPTFEQAVALRRDEIERSDAKGAVAQARYVRGDDQITVEFKPWPEGSKATRIIYRPHLNSLDDCDGFISAFNDRYGHGVEYAGDWLDRPTVRSSNGIVQQEAGGVNASVSCGFSSPAAIYLTQWNARFIFNDLLDSAVGEIVHDF